jgi:hypothetical protein
LFVEACVAKRGTDSPELRIVGNAKPKLRRLHRHEWTRRKEEAFLTTLAETCNVTLAAEAAGMSLTAAYNRRKSHAAFRAGWAEAIATAYQRLELVMLDRALNGTEKVVVRKDGSEERMREYPNQIALHLLKMHRDSAMEAIAEPAEPDVAEVRERLVEDVEHPPGRARQRLHEDEIWKLPFGCPFPCWRPARRKRRWLTMKRCKCSIRWLLRQSRSLRAMIRRLRLRQAAAISSDRCRPASGRNSPIT